MIREIIVLVFQETQFEKVLSQEPVQKRKTAENPLIFKKLWIRLAVELEGWVEGAVILRFSEGMYSYGSPDTSESIRQYFLQFSATKLFTKALFDQV